MDRASILDMMQSKVTTISDFNFDNLMGPPLASLLSPKDIQDLHYIATSVKYSGNAQKKYRAIDAILKPRGFVKMGAGTNRVCYRYLNDTSFVLKVATDAVGIGDNPKEFYNQMILKPFCTKVFEVDPTGTVAVVERVNPITNREEFESVADEIYQVITEFIIGKYIMADIGSHYFMNWGIRSNAVTKFGPVLLDFSFLYELDGDKLYCKEPDVMDPSKPCNGIIDYDDGFNKLYCSKCGKWYRVQELAKSHTHEFKNISINKGEGKMDVIIKRGNTVIKSTNPESGVLNASTAKIEKSTQTSTLADKIELNPLRKKVLPRKKVETTSEKPRHKMFVEQSVPNTNSIGGFVSADTNTSTDKFELKNTKKINASSAYGSMSDSDSTIQRGVVRASNEVSDNDKSEKATDEEKAVVEAIDIPQPSKSKRSIHFKKISYNAAYKTLTLNGETGADRYVVELGANPEIIQQIVDDSEYVKNVLDMKSNTITTLQKNNADLNEENERLREKLNSIEEEANDEVEEDGTDPITELKNRLAELENRNVDLMEEIKNLKEAPVNAPKATSVDKSFNASDYLPYCLMDATVTTLGAFDSEVNDSDAELKVITLNNGDDDYLCDQDGNIIAIARINGVLVDRYDQLQPSVDESYDSDSEDNTSQE